MTTHREERTQAVDIRVRSLLADALKEHDLAPSGVAVVAHGGYGRAELGAGSDLDVLLVHDEREITQEALVAIAERLWYPLWDDGVRLDHSVRTVGETLQAAGADLRTALSLLDARHVAGDAALTLRLRTNVLAAWRRTAPGRLPELEAACRDRAARVGELSALLEPDLKEARGGLRDGVVLRALAATWLVDLPQAAIGRHRAELLEVRDALHDVGTGRPTDRLLAEYQDDVAERLGLSGRDALLRKVYAAGRAIAHQSDIAWRRVGHVLDRRTSRRIAGTRPGPPLTPLAPGVVLADGEVGLAPDAPIDADPHLGLRAAHAAATRGRLLSPYAAHRLARSFVPLPEPWTAETRRLFTGLLGAGPALLPVWETLDEAGLVDAWLPEWRRVRCAPQWSPVHRHTLDRHLLETCREAAALVREVSRPDLLLVAALLHDIGKGLPGDHASNGAALTREIAARMGFDASDVGVLATLVRHHLLLIETATQRDLDDATTVRNVAVEVSDADTLDLLAALTRADARATGGAAWTPWRDRLLTRLVDLVRARLEHGVVAAPTPLEPAQRMLAARDGVEVVVESTPAVGIGSSRLTVAAPDRIGLLATIAGVLGASRLSIRAASVHTLGRSGVSVWWVDGDPPDPAVVRDRIRAALEGDLDLRERLTRLDAGYSNFGAGAQPPPAPRARVVPRASSTATVVEVRAYDRPGLFHQLCRVIADHGCSVRSAHVTTLANEAVDVCYLVDGDGRTLTEAASTRLCRALEAALADVRQITGGTSGATFGGT